MVEDLAIVNGRALASLDGLHRALVTAEARVQCHAALLEAAVAMRPMCLFNHPLFPGQRFHLNAGSWPRH